jgi:hypothetical protein
MKIGYVERKVKAGVGDTLSFDGSEALTKSRRRDEYVIYV